MANKKFIVKLGEDERGRLDALISKGKAAAKTILKARILLKADQSEAGDSWSDEQICAALDTNVSMVAGVRATLVEEGLVVLKARFATTRCSRAKSARRRRSCRSSTVRSRPS